MYENEKKLKITSIVLIVYGIFDILELLFLVILQAIVSTVSGNNFSDLILVIIQSLLIFGGAVLNCMTGWMGFRILNRRGKENLFKMVGYLLLAVIILELLFAIVLSAFQLRIVAQVVIHIVFVYCCLRYGAAVIQGQSIWDIQQD